ncbi:MAG TPA: cellulase family glycosylhydrolase [Steroidobacteraceae bacterium]|nr:cellulase family glycosylhydrolase [Steroidobacteraceae bacterium]
MLGSILSHPLGAFFLPLLLLGLALPATGAGTTGPTSSAVRPHGNPGNGFFVLNGKLFDPAGHEFRIRGVNRLHWDSPSADGIARSGANTERWDIDFTRPPAANVALIRHESIARRIVPIVGNWGGTCSSDTAKLASMVATWVAQARQWTRLNRDLILNVANEWGPPDSTVWRDAYVSAVGRLRAAGYTGPILIDSGGCGQDDADLVKYSQAVFDSDPERNVMFALHLYGGTNDYSASIRSVSKGATTELTLAAEGPTHPFAPSFNGHDNSYSGIGAYEVSGARGMVQLNGRQPASQNVGGRPGAWTVSLTRDSRSWPDYAGDGTIVDFNGNYALKIARLAGLAQRTGAVYIIGEFGPGRNIGPSPTRVTPAEILTAAQADGVGWLAWAWDDNNLPNASADDHWFSMTYHGPGIFRHDADLTRFGRDVVLNPLYGLKARAHAATAF